LGQEKGKKEECGNNDEGGFVAHFFLLDFIYGKGEDLEFFRI